MSDKFHSLSVILSEDKTEEETEAIVNAIKMTKGVMAVRTHTADINSLMAESRAKTKMLRKLYDIADEFRG